MKKNTYQLIVFDWDGTLMDSTSAIVRAVQHAFRELELPVPAEHHARHIIGLGLEEAMRHLHPSLPSSAYGDLMGAYRRYYLSHDNEIALFEGVERTLAHLKEAGFLLAVATGKSRVGLNRALKSSGLGSYFDYTRCADEAYSKPHPQMLLDILGYLGGLDPRSTLMIGDTTHDLLLAQNAGTDALAIACGAHPKEALASLNPLAVCETFGAVEQWLHRFA